MEKTEKLLSPVKRLRKDVVSRIELENNFDMNQNSSKILLMDYLSNSSAGLETIITLNTIKVPNHFNYISDYFMSEYAKWKNDSYVFINCGTGTGKTTFIEKMVQTRRYRILVLTNRKANRQQIQKHLCLDCDMDLKFVVKVMSYQELETYDELTSENLDTFDYIFCDESHYFLQDSTFNALVNISLWKIMGTRRAIKVFTSATNENIQKIIIQRLSRRYNNDLIVAQKILSYEFSKCATYVNNIICFTDFKQDLLEEVIHSTDQWLIFVKNINQGKELCHQISRTLGDDCIFLDRDSADEGTKIQRETFKNLILNENFAQKVLITTRLLDNGVNVFSTLLKNLVIFDDDPVEIIQMIGRKRSCHSSDSFNLYILNESKQALSSTLQMKLTKRRKFKDVRNDVENKPVLNKIHYSNAKEGIEYRCMSYFNPYFNDYHFNYLGYQQIKNEIESTIALRNYSSPFDLKSNLIITKTCKNQKIHVKNLEEVKRKKFLSEIEPLINVSMPYASKKEKIAFHKLISLHYWNSYQKVGNERKDRPLKLEVLREHFKEHKIPLTFKLSNDDTIALIKK